MPLSKNVGTRLREMRKHSKYGLKGAAPKVGISYTHLSKVENGVKVPSQGLIMQLCELYGTDPDQLLAMNGTLPADIKVIVQTHGKEAFDLLRSAFTED